MVMLFSYSPGGNAGLAGFDSFSEYRVIFQSYLVNYLDFWEPSQK